MRQPITLRVPIEDDWDAGIQLQAYTDRGGGEIDTDRPLLGKAKQVFPGRQRMGGFGRHIHGYARHGDLRAGRPRNGGWGDHRWGQIAHGSSQPYARVTVNVPAAYGLWKFAVQAVDAEGNAQAGALIELERVVSGTEPEPLRRFVLSSYDSENDRFTFGVE